MSQKSHSPFVLLFCSRKAYFFNVCKCVLYYDLSTLNNTGFKQIYQTFVSSFPLKADSHADIQISCILVGYLSFIGRFMLMI